MGDYKDYMLKFSYFSLKKSLEKYMGKNATDLIIEWFPSSDTLLTKQRMVYMINAIKGTSIFKDSQFRKNLLNQMKKTEIINIRDEFLKGSDLSENDPVILVDIISKKQWRKNSRLSSYLAKCWGAPDTLFDKENDDTIVDNVLNSQNERFYELFDYQFYIKQRVLNNLNDPELFLERMLIQMPTGTGKTKTTMHIIVNYISFSLKKRGLVIWIAHTNELLEQAYETFVSVWKNLGDGEIHAYKLWGKHNISDIQRPLNGIVFCGCDKLISIAKDNLKLFERLNADCRLLIFDEAHRIAASQTRNTIEKFMSLKGERDEERKDRALIGLTATPGRTTDDSFDNNLLTEMFGGKIIHIDVDILNQINFGKLEALNTIEENNIIKFFQEKGVLAKMKPQSLRYKKDFTDKELKKLEGEINENNEADYTKKQLEVLAQNKARNLTILEKLRQLHDDKIPTIVFACSLNHAKMISAMLSLEDIPNSLVYGEMDYLDRKRAINEFKDKTSEVNIIINYDVLTTGFDSTNIRCVFITRPTKSIVLYSQMLGRGLRGPLMGGNEECTLIDIDDNLQAFDNEAAYSYFNNYWRI